MKTRAPARKRVYLVDDHAVVREGLRRVLERKGTLLVCGESADGADALARIPKARPDLVVADLSLPGMDGLELLRALKDRAPRLPVLVLSLQEEAVYAERALRAGAKGYVMKSERPEEVVRAVEKVLAGQVALTPSMSERVLSHLSGGKDKTPDRPEDALSDRELGVFRLTGEGLKTCDVAERLHLSRKTVESYKTQIKEKLNLVSSGELVRVAIQWCHPMVTGVK